MLQLSSRFSSLERQSDSIDVEVSLCRLCLFMAAHDLSPQLFLSRIFLSSFALLKEEEESTRALHGREGGVSKKREKEKKA